MIIIGYQGIGKTTLSKKENGYLDFESSSFYSNGFRPKAWADYYCNAAEDFSRNGFNVFISSHKEVRNKLKKSKETVVAVIPSLELKESWINKLLDRYKTTLSEKDHRAYIYAKENFDESILGILNDCENVIIIESMDYDLDSLLHIYFSEQNSLQENDDEERNE